MQDTHLSGRYNVVLLGDSLGDANMDGGIPYNTVLRIGFFNSNLVIERLNCYCLENLIILMIYLCIILYINILYDNDYF